MYESPEVTAEEIETIRISKLPITNGNLIYRALTQNVDCNAVQIKLAFKKLLSLDSRYNPSSNTVYRFEVGEMKTCYPLTYLVRIHNQTERKSHSFVLDKQDI